MAAPIGNRFWELRSKHGRDKLFATPELLWDAAQEYFQSVIDNPWYKIEAVKSGDNAGMLIEVPAVPPFTIEGLCMYFECSDKWFGEFYKANIENTTWQPTLDRIKHTIRRQKFEGATIGVFNPLIISRDLGLTEKLQHANDPNNPMPAAQVQIFLPQKGSTEQRTIDLPATEYEDV